LIRFYAQAFDSKRPQHESWRIEERANVSISQHSVTFRDSCAEQPLEQRTSGGSCILTAGLFTMRWDSGCRAQDRKVETKDLGGANKHGLAVLFQRPQEQRTSGGDAPVVALTNSLLGCAENFPFRTPVPKGMFLARCFVRAGARLCRDFLRCSAAPAVLIAWGRKSASLRLASPSTRHGRRLSDLLFATDPS
jgi:hypothetical protein